MRIHFCEITEPSATVEKHGDVYRVSVLTKDGVADTAQTFATHAEAKELADRINKWVCRHGPIKDWIDSVWPS